jgi:ATP-binding cassette subfamily F protein 3
MNPLIRIEEGFFQYNDGKPILRDINFTVEMESRIAIVGANGVGKTTLLNLLIDKLKITQGDYIRNQRVRVGLFTQHHIDQLNLMLSALEQL